VIGSEHAAHVLRVEPLGACRETDEIDEDDCDDLALLDEAAGFGLERAGAGIAEPGLVRIHPATIPADHCVVP
jgi:hypothetical protein